MKTIPHSLSEPPVLPKRIDYHQIVDVFLNQKIRPRLRSKGVYGEEAYELLERLEEELARLIEDQFVY